ncbi:MAG TPA: hypothetical protein VK172_15865 [Lentimicrobium sp.]|nr:hypothetical protein [Lentimicrobium sp.]
MTKRRRVRFRNITFKFTVQQKRRVDAYCNRHGTTPIRLYKKAIMHYLANNGFGDDYHLQHEPAKNQMTIFDLLNQVESQ